jgi:hypothetical protein
VLRKVRSLTPTKSVEGIERKKRSARTFSSTGKPNEIGRRPYAPMDRLKPTQLVVAFAVIGIALAVLYYAVVTDVLSNYGYRSKVGAIGGALFVIGGTSIWLLGKLLGALASRFHGVSYVLSFDGQEESFRNKKQADEKIAEILSKGIPLAEVKLKKVTTNTDSNGSVVMHTEDIPVTSSH